MNKFFPKMDNFAVLLWVETVIFIVAVSLVFILPIKIL